MDKNDQEKPVNTTWLVIRGLIWLPAIIIAIFLLAGRLSYWQGWLFSIMILVVSAVSLIVFRRDQDLARERLKPGPGMKWWDKVFMVFFGPLNLALVVVAALDAGRFQWTPSLPVFVYLISWLVQLLSYYLVFWAIKVNRFFSSVVRIQDDRGHLLIQDGPYRWVRHPGYLAGILMEPSMPLVLGSLWALIPALVLTLLLIARTILEDGVLKKELPGYLEYAQKVPYRLIPGLW